MDTSGLIQIRKKDQWRMEENMFAEQNNLVVKLMLISQQVRLHENKDYFDI